MKTSLYTLFIGLCFSISTSCNPTAGLEPITENVKLNIVLSNNAEAISLGDTLKLRLTLPDTIVSNVRTQQLQSLQRAFFAMRTFRVDTINRRAVNVPLSEVWTSIGNIENDLSYVMKNSSKPFEVIINFKPSQKGLYYFEIIPQPGTLRINGNGERNLIVNFAAADKHLTLVSGYFGGQIWLDEANNRNSQGFGVYAFKVN